MLLKIILWLSLFRFSLFSSCRFYPSSAFRFLVLFRPASFRFVASFWACTVSFRHFAAVAEQLSKWTDVYLSAAVRTVQAPKRKNKQATRQVQNSVNKWKNIVLNSIECRIPSNCRRHRRRRKVFLIQKYLAFVLCGTKCVSSFFGFMFHVMFNCARVSLNVQPNTNANDLTHIHK